jgi:hypothetical protein
MAVPSLARISSLLHHNLSFLIILHSDRPPGRYDSTKEANVLCCVRSYVVTGRQVLVKTEGAFCKPSGVLFLKQIGNSLLWDRLTAFVCQEILERSCWCAVGWCDRTHSSAYGCEFLLTNRVTTKDILQCDLYSLYLLHHPRRVSV